MQKPEYKFKHDDSVIFITGVPLSGKSTISPLVAASIEGCTVQPMDIFRLISQKIESMKPECEQNPFVQAGSCDSYVFVGNGSYSPKSLIEGFREYSAAVASVLEIVMPELEKQGVRNIIFEGVQLTPEYVETYLEKGNNALFVISANKERLEANRAALFGSDEAMRERYSTEKLLLLQSEIERQAGQLVGGRVNIVENNDDDYTKAAENVLKMLLENDIIERRS
jgi:2-phosphoglycerate kinase